MLFHAEGEEPRRSLREDYHRNKGPDLQQTRKSEQGIDAGEEVEYLQRKQADDVHLQTHRIESVSPGEFARRAGCGCTLNLSVVM